MWSSRKLRWLGLAVAALCAGLALCAGAAWRSERKARGAGRAMLKMLSTDWPDRGAPQVGMRERLCAAAEHLRSGAFASATSALGPGQALSRSQRADAVRFIAQHGFRERFVAAASAAQAWQQRGADVGAARYTLRRTLAAASRQDTQATEQQLRAAEAALDGVGLGQPGRGTGDSAEAVAALAMCIEPAFRLGRELMTEGHCAVEPLVRRASWHCQENEFGRAAVALRAAAGLLGLRPASQADGRLPEWFTALAEPPLADAQGAKAQALLALCEASAAAEAPAPAVVWLVQRSRRELDAGRLREAHWWGSVALRALGMAEPAASAQVPAPQSEEVQ